MNHEFDGVTPDMIRAAEKRAAAVAADRGAQPAPAEARKQTTRELAEADAPAKSKRRKS